MPVLHENLARICFTERADLTIALSDDVFRALVLRVIKNDVYVRPDNLQAALSCLERADLWYHQE